VEKWIYTQEGELINVSKIECIKCCELNITAVMAAGRINLLSFTGIFLDWNSEYSKKEVKRVEEENESQHNQLRHIYCDLMIFLEDDSKHILFVNNLINKKYKEKN